MQKQSFIFILLLSLLFLTLKTANAETAATWQGEIDSVPVWITVLSQTGQDSNTVPGNSEWWNWGNTTTDTYLLAVKSPQDVRLIVDFNPLDNGTVEALIYVNDLGRKPLEYQIKNKEVKILSNEGHPYLIIHTRAGGWLKNNQANYDLDITVDGPFPGREQDPFPMVTTEGVTDWLVQVGSEQPGIPTWQVLKVVNDPQQKSNYERFSISKRMANAPEFRVEAPWIPGFPSFGVTGREGDDFEKNRSPFFYDLASMSLKFYGYPGSQNGIYGVNSTTPAPDVDFESPYASYNFDPASRYPQLLVRSWYYPADDPLLSGTSPVVPGVATFRYSWKMRDDQKWSYSLQFAGPYSYTDMVQVGPAEIYGVPEDRLLGWINEKRWPILTFVDTNDSYAGSDGVDFYSTQNWDVADWFLGYTDEAPTYFETPYIQETSALFDNSPLPAGFRGEYQVKDSIEAKLYLSPVDGNLHLLKAEGGIWYVGNGHLLRYKNTNGDGYIDRWTREEFPASEIVQGDYYELPDTTVEESLYQLGDYLLYSNENEVRLVKAVLPLSSLDLNPPKDQASWAAFRDQVSPALAKKDPSNLSSWLDGVTGDAQTITGAQVSDVRFTTDGWRFRLTLFLNDAAQGIGIPGIKNLPPGDYLVRYDGSLTVEPMEPVKVNITLSAPEEIGAFAPIHIPLTVINPTNRDLTHVTLAVEDQTDVEAEVIFQKPADLLGGERMDEKVYWQPMHPGARKIVSSILDEGGQVLFSVPVTVIVQKKDIGSVLAVAKMTSSGTILPGLGLLLSVALITALIFRINMHVEKQDS